MDEQNPTPEEVNPPQEDYAGRKDLADLAQAYRASGQEAVRQKQRADTLEQQLQSMQTVANPRQDIPQRGRPSDTLREYGVPVEALDEYVNERLNQAFQPVVKSVQARNEMLANYGPDYTKFESDVAQFVQSDPNLNARYQQLFQADPASAMELAFLKYGESRRREAPTTDANGERSKEQQARAAVPTTRSGGQRSTESVNQDRVFKAWEAFQKSPSRMNAEAYAKARFKDTITDEFLFG